MIDRKEIEHLSDLIKVELKDPEKYIKQVEQILNYFDRLDAVDFDSEETLRKEVKIDGLRDDKYVPFQDNGKPLIDKLKKDPNNYIRAPKMV
jgi:aspartyl/glutamyl-tRNA(Asn/Gln) amidotransferase C subunit